MSLLDRRPFQGRRATIEHKDGQDAEPEQLADAAEEPYDVGVAQGVTFLVADCFEELVDPDGSVDGETLAIESCEVGWTGAGLDDRPETVDTHGDESRW